MHSYPFGRHSHCLVDLDIVRLWQTLALSTHRLWLASTFLMMQIVKIKIFLGQ